MCFCFSDPSFPSSLWQVVKTSQWKIKLRPVAPNSTECHHRIPEFRKALSDIKTGKPSVFFFDFWAKRFDVWTKRDISAFRFDVQSPWISQESVHGKASRCPVKIFPKKTIQCNLWSQITDVSNVFFFRYLHSCKIWKPKFLETRNQDCLDLFGMETKLTFNIMVGDFAIA